MSTVTTVIGQVKSNSTTAIIIGGTPCDDTSLSTLADALKDNTSVTSVQLENVEMGDSAGVKLAKALAVNKTITLLDIGYNKLTAPTMIALGEALKTNKTLNELKIHRQENDMGPAAEKILIEFWKENTTLTRMYATLHDRLANNTNTKNEVRNKEISKRKSAGKSWDDLNPDPEVKKAYMAAQETVRAAEAAAKAATDAPISEKVASTGGPYTLKQLTCAKDFLPDDVDPIKGRETYLSDEDFQTVFGKSKEEFGALPKWKRANLKKGKNLH